MKIKIQGFRCNIDNEYEFENGKLTLLKGESGIGKSTIFQAIYWCLFGNLRNIKSNTTNIKRSNVIIEYDECNLIINRINNPCLLTVLYGNQVYENDVAQDIIKNYFGTKEVWKTCSYIEQGEKCSFLHMSNSEKMEFLNMISFNMDNPEDYIQKVENKIKEIQNYFIDFNNKYTYNFNKLSNTIYNNETLDSFEILEKELQKLEKMKLELYEKVLSNNKLKGVKETFEQELIKKEKFVKTFDDNSFCDLKSLLDDKEKKIIKMNESLTKKQQYLYFLGIHNKKQEIFKKLNSYPKFNYMYNNVTEQLYYDILNQKELYNKFLNKLKSLEIDRVEENVVCENSIEKLVCENSIEKLVCENSIEKLVFEKEKCQKILEYNKIKNEIDRIVKFVAVLPEFNDKDIELNQEILTNLNIELKNKIEAFNLESTNIKNSCNEELNKNNDKINLQRNKLEELKIKLNNELKNLYEETNKNEYKIKGGYTVEKNNIINNYNNEIQRLNIRLKELDNILSCPHCNGSVKIINQCIIKSTENLEDKKIINEEIGNLKNNYEINLKNLDNLYNDNMNKLKERYNLQFKDINNRYNLVEDEEILNKLLKEYTETNNKYNTILNNLNLNTTNETKIIKEKIYNIENEIRKLTNTKNNIIQMKEQNSKIENEIQRLSDLLNNLNINGDLYSISKCNEILNLQYVNKPLYDENIIKQKLEYEKLLKEYNNLQDIDESLLVCDVEDVSIEDINKLKNDICKLKIDIENQLRNKYEYEENERSINEIKIKLKDLIIDNNVEKNYESTIQKIKKINDDIIKSKQNLEYINLYNETNEFYQQREKYNTMLTYYNDFKKVCIETEIQQLETTINTINNVVNQILTNLFDSPINLCLQFFKELKTDKRIKTQINMVIYYKGVEYDNINQLSGGEVDRISLALTLTFNFVFNSTFLLLDECMSSLNENFRNMCLKELKKFNKTIIVVNHEDIEGTYDNVINLV